MTRIFSARLVPFAAALLAAGVVTPVGAQAPRRFGRPLGPPPNAPRIMVATPYTFAGADSSAAVLIGRGLRDRFSDLAGRDFTVIPDSVMNSALVQYGYSADAILSPALALTLAKNIQARFIVQSQLSKLEGGRFGLQTRLVGVNDDAGITIGSQQLATDKLEKFGEKTGVLFQKAVQHLNDARECMNLRASKADKAIEAGQKTLKDLPTHGLANLCLAQIAQDQKKPRPEIIGFLKNAVAGDSLSLVAWGLLASQYEQAGDTANTLTSYSQLLRVAPSNQKLREDIFKRFLAYGKTDLAKNVADEGLALDPTNADLYDLKSNACLFGENYKCAIDALEQLYAIDSAKADTLFFYKIAAATDAQPDTARLVTWTSRGVLKYPENATLLGYLNKGLALQGKTDSSLAITKKLMVADPTQLKPALAAVQTLITAKRFDEIGPYAEFIEKNPDTSGKETLAQLYVAAANQKLQQPQDLDGARTLSAKALAAGGPTSRVAPQANLIGGIATFVLGTKADSVAAANKSCEGVQGAATLFAEAKTSLTNGRSVRAELADQYLGYVGQYETRNAALTKAFCGGGAAAAGGAAPAPAPAAGGAAAPARRPAARPKR
ncbi:MAG: hypothetical protein NW201_12200 [Gemmatimonadales bacterium]|nr:hypothetical protein [Gemmatimonadales bacterium]